MPTILIADDSAARRRIISSALEQAGYEVVLAADGVEAIQSVFRDQPDLLIVDAEMPRLSGYVVTRLLKDDWQTEHIPIVIIASDTTAADRYRGEQTGAELRLTKDFGAAELVPTVQHVLAAAEAKQQAIGPLTPSPSMELTVDDVLGRVSELLDRKLFEAKICADVTQIASDVHGFEETVAAVLEGLGRLVDHDLAALCLLDTRSTYLNVARESSYPQYVAFCSAIADVAGNMVGQPVLVTDLVPRVADPAGLLGSDEDDMAAFMFLPLRAGGRILGCLALSSSTPDAFGDLALDSLRLIEHPVAVVLSNAQLAGESSVAWVA